MTIDKTTPNFFILLGLNPDERWDPAKFEQVYREKRIEWSRQSSGVAKKALTAKKNLELLPEIRRVMEDPALREEQATAARAELASDQKVALDRFEKELTYINVKGHIEQSELDAFTTTFKTILPEREILSRIKVKIGAPSTQTTQQALQLETSIYKDITDKLQTLHLANLYELLGRPETTSNEELCRAAEQLYDEMVRRQPKTAEVTAKTDLAGHAKTIFKSKELRERYNESIRLSSLNTLLKELDEIVSRTIDKELYEGQLVIFLKGAREVGWKDEIALAHLKEYARQRKWIIHTIPTIDTQQQRCGYCHELNEQSRNHCRACNEPLAIPCPNCGLRAASDEIWCGSCGFSIGNRYWVDELLKRSAAVQGHDLKQALELLQEAESIWKPDRPDERVRRLQQQKSAIQQRVQAQQRSIEQLQQLIHQHKLYTARQYTVVHSEGSGQNEPLQRVIDDGIAQAQGLLKQAQARSISQEERIELCRQALRLCTDYQEARDLLSATPPAPPHNLQAQAGEILVSLTWEPSATPNVNYSIVRKSHSQPVSTKDGVLLGTVAGRIYDDTTPEVGVPLYYVVFTNCEDVVSLQGATLSTPVLLTSDIFNETVKVNDQHISISWQTPPNVQSILAVRNDQADPRSSHDGKHLVVSSFANLVDFDVQNGHTYYYRIYCQFKDHQGNLVTSPGKTISATPETPPSAITRLEIISTKTPHGYRVQLRWARPKKGKVIIVKSAQPLPFKVDEVVPLTQLHSYGQILQDRIDTLTDLWQHSGVGYYTPIVAFGTMAYIGSAQRYVCVDEVEGLTYTNIGTALQLQWQWPQQCQEVLVAYRHDGWPELNGSAQEIIRRVTRAEYDSLGHCSIRGAMERDYYITVAAIVKEGNNPMMGSGVHLQARLASKIVLTYEIKQTGFLHKKRTLHLYSRKPGLLPDLLLVSKRERLPLYKNEGEIFHRVQGPLSIEKELSIELPEKAFPPKTFGKLYLEDDKAYEVVNIHHPSEDKLRLS